MAKSKKDIKKLIEDLHAKPNPGQQTPGHHAEHGPPVKGPKGAKRPGTYRPKV